MKKNILYTALLISILCLSFLGCSSTPESDSVGPLTQNDLIGSWKIGQTFTYKDEGVAYGKASDTLVFSEGSSDDSLFLEVIVTITETTSDAPEGFEVGSTHTLFFNETGVVASENSITLDAKSPYISPSAFNFAFEEGNKDAFVWDGIKYSKQ